MSESSPSKGDDNISVPPNAVALIPPVNSIAQISPWVNGNDPGSSWTQAEPNIRIHQQTTSFPNAPFEPNPKQLDPEITLLVGKQDHHSRYLTRQVFRVPTSVLQHSKRLSKYEIYGGTSSTLIKMPDLDPDAFKMYYEYICTGAIIFPKGAAMGGQSTTAWNWVGCWPLINAHILSTKLQDPKFGDYVLNFLNERLEWRDRVDVETVQHVFTKIGVGEQLKTFIVEAALCGGVSNFETRQLELYPFSFIRMALERAAYKLQILNSSNNPENAGPGTDAAAKAEAMRLMKERLIAAATTRDSQQARADSESHSVRTVDWMYRNQVNVAEKQLLAVDKNCRPRTSQSMEKSTAQTPSSNQKQKPETAAQGNYIQVIEEAESPQPSINEKPKDCGPAIPANREEVKDHATNSALNVNQPCTVANPDSKLNGVAVDYSPSAESTWGLSDEVVGILEKAFDKNSLIVPGAYPESTVGYE